MLISKKRIRNLENYLYSLKENETFVVGISNIPRFDRQLLQAGFSSSMEVGERILPSCIFGSVSRFNSIGNYLKHKDQPMETAYRVGEWHWQEFHGRNNKIARSKLVDIPYKRYLRTFISPPSLEILIDVDNTGNKIVISDKLSNKKTEHEKIIHIINLFLEIFGEAQILNEDLENFYQAPIKRLNWKILPEGQMPWSRLSVEIGPIINKAPQGKRSVILDRLKTINIYKPEFVAVGQAGFDGYLVFAFPEKNLYVCESIHLENATYVFEKNWEQLSKMTKAEILNNTYQKGRIIHRVNWHKLIDELLLNGNKEEKLGL